MRIATWNINSVRLRLSLVERLLQEEQPDILCLQETKVVDDAFPHQMFESMGYIHRAIRGMKSYNGVAILSRVPLSDVESLPWCGKHDCRHIAATVPSGCRLHCFYIPAGGDIPDPELNDKFAHKLGFLDEMKAYWSSSTSHQPSIMVGDFNIAPHENDVWSHKQLLDVVSHTPIEVEKLSALQRTREWIDILRALSTDDQKLYSWWSYRAKDWELSNRGRRLDHIWATPDLKSAIKSAKIRRDIRGWDPKPSDHVPVLADFDLD